MTNSPAGLDATRKATRWTVTVVVTGLVAGLAGMALLLLMSLVDIVAFSGDGDPRHALLDADPWRRVAAGTLAGLMCGVIWSWLRADGYIYAARGSRFQRMPTWPTPDDPDIRKPYTPRQVVRTVIDAAVQMTFVSAGASIGREGAPRQSASALTGLIFRRKPHWPISPPVVLAAAAGAGLAAVYSTPVAGALFATEVLLAKITRANFFAALAMCTIATFAAYPVTHVAAVYPWPGGHLDAWVLVAVLVLPLPAGLVGWAFTALAQRARQAAPGPGWPLVASVTAAGAALGAVAWKLPELTGNGQPIVDGVVHGKFSLALVAAFLVLKPLATCAFLRAGATGGLLTPALATGVAGGATTALVADSAGLPVTTAAWAFCGAAAVLAVTNDAPWFAAAFVIEMVRPPWPLAVALVVTALLSHYVIKALAAHLARRRAPKITV